METRRSRTPTEGGAVKLGDGIGPVVAARCKCGAETSAIRYGGKAITAMCQACADAVDHRREESVRAQSEERARQKSDSWPQYLKACADAADEQLHISADSFPAGTRLGDVASKFIAGFLGGHGEARSLYIVGLTGVGKTALAVAIMHGIYLAAGSRAPRMYLDWARRFVRRTQAGYSTGLSDQMIEDRIEADLWVLDDAGTERASADALGILSEIIVCRARKPTIITSNISAEEWSSRPGLERVSSRLGYFEDLVIRGSDRRFEAI